MSSLIHRVLGRLIDYPVAEMQDALPTMMEVVRAERGIPGPVREALLQWMQRLADTPLLELQERHVELFDRGRHLSLHLFEHVHGESRERGQAMVDLAGLYRDSGYALDARELPDYLPLMLEFLSTRDHAGAMELLEDALPVIALLGARLRERGLGHALVFDALEALAGGSAELDEIRRQVRDEPPDDTLTRMDEIWEEEQVTFLAGSDPSGQGCQGSTQTKAVPVAVPTTPSRSRRAAAG